jgi:membrane-bound serine protease (ClpP class)
MQLLFDPNVAYLLLVAGMLLALLAIMTPGTGIVEILSVFAVLLAGYAVYHLSFNWWALLILLVSLVPFVYSIRAPGRGAWLVASIAGLTLGSVFFFPATNGLTAVNPLIATGTTILYSAFLWVAVRKIVEAAQFRPVHELTSLIGKTGEAKTAVKEDGSVQVAGELWSARSARPLAPGSPVKVIGRDGFVLIVEKDSSS